MGTARGGAPSLRGLRLPDHRLLGNRRRCQLLPVVQPARVLCGAHNKASEVADVESDGGSCCACASKVG